MIRNRLLAASVAVLLATSASAQLYPPGPGPAPSSGGSSTGANPTATIATTAVNGTATTFMRSDAAPAIPSAGITNTSGTAYTLTGSAAQTYTFPTTTASIARTDASQGFSGTQTLAVVQINSTLTMGGGTAVIVNDRILNNTAPTACTVSGVTTCTVTKNAGSVAAKYTLTTGTPTASVVTLNMPSGSINGWVCDGVALTSGLRLQQTNDSSTAVTMQGYTPAGATSTNFSASDVLLVKCMGY